MTDYYLVYDDLCPLCVRAVGAVTTLDRLGLVRLIPLSVVHESAGLSAIPLPLDEEMRKAIHLFASDGRIWVGSDAIGRLGSLFPESRLVGRIILLPGVRVLARAVYRFVARRRMRYSGGKNAEVSESPVAR